jgi:hypothetical protein
MIMLVALDRKPYDDRIQKCGIINCDIAATKVVSYVKLELVGSGDHRSAIKQRFLRATIGIRRRASDLQTPISQLK